MKPGEILDSCRCSGPLTPVSYEQRGATVVPTRPGPCRRCAELAVEAGRENERRRISKWISEAAQRVLDTNVDPTVRLSVYAVLNQLAAEVRS